MTLRDDFDGSLILFGWNWHFGWWHRPFGIRAPADGITQTTMQTWRLGLWGLTRWKFGA